MTSGAFDHFSPRYEETGRTLRLWKALGSRRRTEVTVMRAVGVELSRHAVAFGVELDYSMVRGVRDEESAAIQTWWRGEHHAYLDARLRSLGLSARFDLDLNAPAVLSSSSERVSITKRWGHLTYPVVRLATAPRWCFGSSE